MPIHNFDLPRGRIEDLTIESSAISNNLLGDPATRNVAIYLPPGYDESNEEYPLFVDIVGFTGSGYAHVGWKIYGESVPQRIDRLVAEGKMGPVIVALPDCFTSLGGNQYVNSAAMGKWADFLTTEMIPAIEARYRVKKGNGARAVFGKSSGGYGSIAHGMLYAEDWGAIACHSGDMAFEWCYLPDIPDTVMHLAKFDRRIDAFIQHTKDSTKVDNGDLHHLMTLAMAATYDPAPDAPYGVRLPVDLETCEVIADRWEKWLAWDPIQMIERNDVQENLRSLKGIYIDCGSEDQYNLIFGARRLSRRMNALGIEHYYEEFDDNHTSVDYRMDVSLPWLYHQLEG